MCACALSNVFGIRMVVSSVVELIQVLGYNMIVLQFCSLLLLLFVLLSNDMMMKYANNITSNLNVVISVEYIRVVNDIWGTFLIKFRLSCKKLFIFFLLLRLMRHVMFVVHFLFFIVVTCQKTTHPIVCVSSADIIPNTG